MKKLSIILGLLFFSVASSQAIKNGQSGVHAEYGFSPSKEDLKSGYFVKAGYSRVMGEKGFLGKAEFFYQSSEVKYYNNIMPYAKYGINVNAGYGYEGLYPVVLTAWLGVFGSLENVNKGNENYPNSSAIIPEKTNSFTYGISGSLGGEIFITNNLAFLVNYSQFYDVASKFSKSNYGIFGGLKFYIK